MKIARKFNLKDNESGFTLIELLVVILIIGILAAIAVPVFLNQRQTANDAAVESDVKNIIATVETYFAGKPATTTLDLNYLKANGTKSTGVVLRFQGNANDYCVWATHTNAGKYKGGGWIPPDTLRPYYLFSNKEGGYVQDRTKGTTNLTCSTYGDSALVWP